MLLQFDWSPVTPSARRREPLDQKTSSYNLIDGSSELSSCSVTEHVASSPSLPITQFTGSLVTFRDLTPLTN